MSSYVLILMVAALLNILPPFPTIGHSFSEALRYYGKEFDTNYLAVCGGSRIMVKNIPTPELVVFDVFLPEVNAAANMTLFERIRAVFAKAYDALCAEPQATPILETVLALVIDG